MKEQMEKLLTEGTGELISFLKAGKEFVVEQSPLIVQEIMSWGMGESIFWIIFSGIGVILCICGVMWVVKNPPSYSNDGPIFILIPSLFGGVGFVFGLAVNIHTLIKIWLAPRLYIIDYLKSNM